MGIVDVAPAPENAWIFFFLERATKDCAVLVFVGIDIAVEASVHDGSRLRPEIIPVRAPFPAPSESCKGESGDHGPERVSVMTLGVKDLGTSKRFYVDGFVGSRYMRTTRSSSSKQAGWFFLRD